MINIIVELVKYINTLTLYSPLVIDFFQGNLEEIMIRHEPSQAKEISYMDGSRIGTFNFSIHAKSLNGKTAVDQLNYLIQKLDLNNQFELTPLIKVKIEPITTPMFTTKTDKNEFIYQCSFSLEYEARRN